MTKKLLGSIFAIITLILLIYQLYICSDIGFTKDLVQLKLAFIPMWMACLLTTIFTPIIVFNLIQNISFENLDVSKKN